MRLTWVNHASFLLESGNVRLLCDPWIEGTVFNNGWHLLSPSRFSYSDFARVTHIWFSHEHPDHFLPPNLKRIPEEFRRRIKVLFHETRDKRVVRACQALGFSVEELPERVPVSIGPDFTVTCGLNDLIDSWLLIRAESKTVANFNDCVFPSDLELIAVRDLAGPVDLLLSQFSYANWVGNPGDLATHRSHARHKRDEMAKQIQILRPRQFIPFASYVYFCHRENSFMNASVNHIADIHDLVSRDLRVDNIVLYPGEHWEVGSSHDSSAAIASYEADFHAAIAQPPLSSESVPLSRLQEAMQSLVEKCKRGNNLILLLAMPPAVAQLSDLGIQVELSYRHGLRQVSGRQPDIVLSSDSLFYCITTDWGGDTLKINGRFEAPSSGSLSRFFQLFRVPQYNSYGSSLNFAFLARQALQRARRASAV